MSETKKTIYFAAAAVVLALVAFIMAPQRLTPDAFLDQGEAFFQEFTDPNEATTLEVVTYDETTGSAVPFKVTFEGGRWTIPSHHNYPADAKDRLAKSAASVIDLKKDDFRSDNVSDHEACGVLDPLDETAGMTGRGQRITIKGEGGKLLADLIVGMPVEGRENMRFVRLPDQNRVFAVRADIDLSTRFEDWIETDLLKVMKHRIENITLMDYSINERTLSVDNRDVVRLTKKGGEWTADKLASGKVVDSTRMEGLLTALDSLAIVGVRTKPEGLSAGLLTQTNKQTMSQSDLRSLQSKGFYVGRNGQLLSNEGELQFETADGVRYVLRFGEVVYGSGLLLTAGVGGSDESARSGAAGNRYLFITTEFDNRYFKEPTRPADTSFSQKADSLWTVSDRENKGVYDKHLQWRRDVERGQKLSADMNARFADWYYVISSDSFKKLRLKRSDLIRNKTDAD